MYRSSSLSSSSEVPLIQIQSFFQYLTRPNVTAWSQDTNQVNGSDQENAKNPKIQQKMLSGRALELTLESIVVSAQHDRKGRSLEDDCEGEDDDNTKDDVEGRASHQWTLAGVVSKQWSQVCRTWIRWNIYQCGLL